jgi:hypothetical protein
VKSDAYLAMLKEKGWQAQPWDSRDGIGKHLTELTGGKRQTGYLNEADGGKRRARGYLIPRADNVVSLAGRREAS